MSASIFTTELQLFEENRELWLRAHTGEFVAIQGGVVAGFFSDYASALKAGLKQFGASRNFLVKQVWQTDPVYSVS